MPAMTHRRLEDIHRHLMESVHPQVRSQVETGQAVWIVGNHELHVGFAVLRCGVNGGVEIQVDAVCDRRGNLFLFSLVRWMVEMGKLTVATFTQPRLESALPTTMTMCERTIFGIWTRVLASSLQRPRLLKR